MPLPDDISRIAALGALAHMPPDHPATEEDRRAAREGNWFTRLHDSDKAWAERNGGQRERD